ncbi:hypothetical protein ACWCXB_13075, partial [Streptomyces sp. NPDC001514]
MDARRLDGLPFLGDQEGLIFQRPPGRGLTGRRVEEIDHHPDSVTVRTGDGAAYRGAEVEQETAEAVRAGWLDDTAPDADPARAALA